MQSTIGAVSPFQQTLADIDADGRYRTERGMNNYSSIAARVLTDIAVSVILGLTLVAVVWLADTLHISPTKGATVREALRLASNYADLPQWWWMGLYALVAGISVVFAGIHPHPDRLPVEAAFSLLARRQPRIADRPGPRSAISAANNITSRSQPERRCVGDGVADVLDDDLGLARQSLCSGPS